MIPSTKWTCPLAIVVSALLAVPACAVAQTAQKTDVPAASASPSRADPETDAVLDSVEVTGAKLADSREAATTAVISVSREEMLKNGDSTVSDALKRLPGVSIDGVQGRGGEIRMRGLGSGYTQILVNGERVPPGFSIDSLSPELIERIDVIRSGTADLGAQGIAGTINIILTRKAQTTAAAQREVKIGLTDENGQLAANVSGRFAKRSGNTSYSIAGAANSERRTRPARLEEVGTDAYGTLNLRRVTQRTGDVRTSTLSLTPQINWKLTNDNALGWDGFLSATRTRGTSFDDTSTLLGSAPPYASNDLHFQLDSTVAQSKINSSFNIGEYGKLDARIGFNHFRRDSLAEFVGFAQSGEHTLTRDVRSRTIDVSLPVSGKFSTPFAENHSLAFGWDGEYGWRDEDRLQDDTVPLGLPQYDIDESYRARVRRLALFAQDDWQILPTWSLYMGLRWEGLQTRTSGTGMEEVSNNSSVLSPILNSMWKLNADKRDQIRVSLGRTYRAPSTIDLAPRRIMANNNSPTNPDAQGNPELRPELAWGLDVAYEHFWGKTGLVSINVFERRIEDVIVHELTTIGDKWVIVPNNRSRARVRGVEFEIKTNLGALSQRTVNVDLRLNVARNWSTVDDVPGPDNRLARQEPLSATVGVDSKFNALPLSMGASFSFQRGGPAQITAAQSTQLPLKRILDVYALWKFNDRTQLRLSAANVLHQDNVARAAYMDNNATLVQDTFTPTNTLVRATLEWKL